MVSIFRFDVYRPASLDDALEFLDREAPDALPLAGGTDILVLARMNLVKFKRLLDLWPLRKSLAYIKREGSYIYIGALTTVYELRHSFLASDRRYWGFIDLFDKFATPYIRNLATVGGNIGTAHPLSDIAILLLSLDAEVKLVSVHGERWVKLEKLYRGKRLLDRKPNEIIVEVRFRDKPENSSTTLMKFDRRNAHIMGYIVHAAYMQLEDNVIRDVALAFDSIGRPYPERAKKVEDFLKGKEFSDDTISIAVNEVLPKEMSRISDYRASAEYRLYLSKVFLRRALFKIRDRIR